MFKKYVGGPLNKFLTRLAFKLGKRLGFMNLYYPLVHGSAKRLHIHPSVNVMNTLFNTRSGDIYVDEGTFFGHNCMVLTGRHPFENGKLKEPRKTNVPSEGYDVKIGKGCWIASGAVIIGGVTIGDNCLIMSGAVVTRDVPDGTVVGGVPAKFIKKTVDIN